MSQRTSSKSLRTFSNGFAYSCLLDETVSPNVTNTTNATAALSRYGIPSYGVYFDGTAGAVVTHVGARPSIGVNSLGNAQWAFTPYPPATNHSATAANQGSGIVAHDAAGVTTGKMTYAKIPAQGMTSPGQLALEELRGGVDTVPPTTIVLYAFGF